jgi:predicted ATPase/class 3 adenylate cyclase
MRELPTGTVTFLFTDLEGSTRLWEQHPDAMRDALARHDEILRAAVEKRGGHVVKTTGDGLHAAFAVAVDGLDAAVDAQRALVGETWALPEPLRVRMGLHTGAAELRDGDYYGGAVNRAARISAAAHGGQIIASAPTTDLARDDLDPEIGLLDLGEHRLRDLGRPEHLYGVSAPDLPAGFPEPRTLDAYPGNLPAQRTAFIGRDAELAEITAALTDAPVVTLTGVGGVGKTRLALQAAAHSVVSFPDGAWFVALAQVTEPEAVAATVATTLELRDQAVPEEALLAALRRKHALLVIDNCEHLVDAVAELAERITESCPGVTLLATSRERLGVDGETVFEVRPLTTDASGSRTIGDAEQLFVDRARAASRGFALDDSTRPVITEICDRLDGIPLAIELAAARLQLLSASEIRDKLDERLRLLTSGRRTASERHQTLRAAIDWSYALLEPTEQRVFARLSVFLGGFTLDAAEAVAGLDEDVDALDAIASLVAKSMLVAEATPLGTRYSMLETIRMYGEERLRESGDHDRARDAHARHYLAFTDAVVPRLTGADDGTWMARFRAETDNYRTALAWTRDQGDTEMLVALAHSLVLPWFASEGAREAFTWLESTLALDIAMTPAVRRDLEAGAGWAALFLAAPSTVEYLEASLRSADEAGTVPHPLALSQLGILALESNRVDDAIELCERAIEAAQSIGNPWIEYETYMHLSLVLSLGAQDGRGRAAADVVLRGAAELDNAILEAVGLLCAGIAEFDGDPAASIPILARCAQRMELFRRWQSVAQALLFQGLAHLRLREIPAAAAAFRAAILRFIEVQAPFHMGNVVAAAASLLTRTDPDTATQLLASLHRYHAETGMAGAPRDIEGQARARARLEQAMVEEQFQTQWRAGEQLSIDDAAYLAYDALEPLASS